MFSEERGFFSIDAFFAFLLLITVFTSLMTVAQENRETAKETARLYIKDMSAEKLAAAIDTVYAGGSPLELTFYLPENALGEDYTMSLNPENRLVIVENSESGLSKAIAKAHIMPKNVSSSVLSPENLSGEIRIFWKNGKVRVEG